NDRGAIVELSFEQFGVAKDDVTSELSSDFSESLRLVPASCLSNSHCFFWRIQDIATDAKLRKNNQSRSLCRSLKRKLKGSTQVASDIKELGLILNGSDDLCLWDRGD